MRTDRGLSSHRLMPDAKTYVMVVRTFVPMYTCTAYSTGTHHAMRCHVAGLQRPCLASEPLEAVDCRWNDNTTTQDHADIDAAANAINKLDHDVNMKQSK